MAKDAQTGRFLRLDPQTHLYANFTADDVTGCWNWTAGKFDTGYGYFKCKELGKPMAASRASWVIHKGPLTRWQFVCHKCDNPACVNPDHLFIGAPKDNVHDMCAKGRVSHGAGRPAAKLTDDKVREMRMMRERGMTYKEIGKEFGVVKSIAHRACAGISWKHVA